MQYIGVDIGSTCTKTVIINDDNRITHMSLLPTGWNSKEAMQRVRQNLIEQGISCDHMPIVSTGYGRGAVEEAFKKVTEITCHAKGAQYLFNSERCHIIDIGGQDTKVIDANNGKVLEFYMNDKCSAGTGKFIEVMANRMNIESLELDDLARHHTKPLEISSMCTVFAESEIISLMGQGESRENICYGILQSVVRKVRQEYAKLQSSSDSIVLTGGLCDHAYLLELLSDSFGRTIQSHPQARYAGAVGAALIGKALHTKRN